MGAENESAEKSAETGGHLTTLCDEEIEYTFGMKNASKWCYFSVREHIHSSAMKNVEIFGNLYYWNKNLLVEFLLSQK